MAPLSSVDARLLGATIEIAIGTLAFCLSLSFICFPAKLHSLSTNRPNRPSSTMAFIFNKRNKNKKGSGGNKKFKWGKKKTKGSSKFASTELPVIEEEEQKREQDVDATDGAVDDATEKRDDVLDFGDISRASTDGNGDDFILNSYNTDGTIDGSQLKSDAEVPVVESTSFSQQLAVAAADAANMFQRMSSTMSVATAPVPIQSEQKQGNEEEKKKDDTVSDHLVEGDAGEAGIKAIGDNNEDESKEDTIKKDDDASKDGRGLIVAWPNTEEKNQGGENAKDSTSAKDVVSNDENIANGKDDDSFQSGGDATKNAHVIVEDTDSPPAANTLADSIGQTEVEDEEDGSPFNVCTDLFRF